MIKAIIWLHRKADSQAKCICGSEMIFVNGWICKRQYRKKEENWIEVDRKCLKRLPKKLLKSMKS